MWLPAAQRSIKYRLHHGLQEMRRSHQFPAFHYRRCRTLNAKGGVTGESTMSTWQPEDQWLPVMHPAGILPLVIGLALAYLVATTLDHLLQLLRGDFFHLR